MVTATWPGGQDIDESALRLGEELGRGGQGRVIRVESPGTGFVYKQYIVPGANSAALKGLVDLPGTLQPTERQRLDRQTAWPLARVLKGGVLSGFLMGEIPAEFLGLNSAGNSKLRELQFLLYEPKPMWGDIVPLDTDGRVEVARECVALFRLMHSKSLVIGDVSMNNLLWAPGDPPSVFLLDCDGIRRLGASPVLAQAATPDWDDPQQPASGADLDTDCYKLALLVGRVLTRQADLRPGSHLPLLPGVPDRVAAEVRVRWKEAAGPRGTRPDAVQWQLALSDRGEIMLPTPPPIRTRSAVPITVDVEQPRGARGSIPLPRPSADPR
jgi:hypothetical protein